MRKVDVDGVVRDVLGNEYLYLNPPCSKWPPGKSPYSLNFKINTLSIVHVVIRPGIIEKYANIFLPNQCLFYISHSTEDTYLCCNLNYMILLFGIL